MRLFPIDDILKNCQDLHTGEPVIRPVTGILGPAWHWETYASLGGKTGLLVEELTCTPMAQEHVMGSWSWQPAYTTLSVTAFLNQH